MLEDRVEVLWTTEVPIPNTSRFTITRNGELLHVAASNVSLFEDRTALPNTTYNYCVGVRAAGGAEEEIACDNGARSIARPTGFGASEGLYEGHVMLSWSDRSEIEAGYNLYRGAGNALRFDGVDDFVTTPGVTDLSESFTFEFWASRQSAGTADFVVNLETKPNGDPVDVDVEIGFASNNQFQMAFGNSVLSTTAAYVDANWHHWAAVYDAPNQRRFLFRDGELVATDVVAVASAPTGDLEFGRRSNTGSGASRGFFHGSLDELRHWSVALTAEEIRARMNGLLSGSEPGLVNYWPMDAASGLVVPDVVGLRPGALTNGTAATAWVVSGTPARYLQIGANQTAYLDKTAVVGFQSYTYEVAAFEDVDGDGVYTPQTDFESERRSDTGWRAFLTPPGNVVASDGQFNDRVRVTWLDGSGAETAYNIYRAGTLIGSTPAGGTTFDALGPAGTHEYCVATVGGGIESIRMCDSGTVGGLAAPANVAATIRTFDDRVRVTWNDVGTTEDGFEVYRDGQLVKMLGQNAQEYNDLSAVQDVEYDYCVRAFSKADPLSPSYSDQVCAPAKGVRAIILDPTEMTATDDEFEDRVEMTWKSASTTAMVFLVYRNNTLIEVLDFNMKAAVDMVLPSDTDTEYCVAGATVVAPAALASPQGRIAQALQTIHNEDAVKRATGGAVTTVEAKMAAVYAALGLEAPSATTGAEAMGFVESNRVCATGSRSLLAPTAVEATDDEFENHVQVTWVDNSGAEVGYRVYRTEGQNAPVLLETVSANRTTFGDYIGAPGVPFTYTVEAFDAYGESFEDGDQGKRTLKAPTNLTATDGTSETVVALNWRDNSGAEDGYRIYRRVVGDPNFQEIGTTGKNEAAYFDSNFPGQLGVAFEYQVVAFDAYGESLPVLDEGKTFIEAPANVNASDVYGNTVVVVWVDRSGVEAGYRLTRRAVGKTTLELDLSLAVNTTHYNDPSAASGVKYEYCVEALLASPIASASVCDIGSLLLGGSSGGGGGGGGPTGPVAVRNGPTGLSSNADNALRYGASVALSEASGALVGVPGADPYGVAHQFSILTTDPWSGLTPFSPTSGAEFGHAVALDGDYAVVGDPSADNDNTGAFSVWKLNAGTWGQVASVVNGTNSGYAVSAAGPFVLVGDNQFDTSLPNRHGGALVCNVDTNPTCAGVPRLETLVPSPAANAAFGNAVALTRVADELYALVGAPGAEKAYVFECNVASSTNQCTEQADWVLAQVLSGTFNPPGKSARFGAAVALDGVLAVIGAPGAPAIAVYERSGPLTWDERQKKSSPEDGFGSALAVLGSTIVVGAPGEEIADQASAGAVYVYQWSTALSDPPVRYDARVAGLVRSGARFGASVDLTANLYAVGAPGDVNGGAVYSIPVGFEPPDDPIVPPDVTLAPPTNVTASDGTAPDRIQVRWVDAAENESGFRIYRSREGGSYEQLSEAGTDVVFFDDFDAAPGEAYTYCVSTFGTSSDGIVETDQACDIGWRPPNGTIAGTVLTGGGGGVEEVQVCLKPDLNKGMLLDGVNGHIVARVFEDQDGNSPLYLERNFTLEAWIRPHAVDGQRTILSRDGAYTLSLNNGDLHFNVVETTGPAGFDAGTQLSPGTWYHVAVVRDEDNDVEFYVDGVSVHTAQSDNLVTSEGQDTLTIGKQFNDTSFFKGELDEVRIWSIARDASQIATFRTAPLTGKEENLVGYWPLDEGARRVVPDVTASANHGQLVDGIYLTDEGADLQVCDVTEADGNFSISRIRYGTTTEFHVIPSRATRMYVPAFAKITLTTESPVQNNVYFNDMTAYTVAGVAHYEDVVAGQTLSCPVPNVRIHASDGPVPSDQNLRITTGADGSFSVSVNPSIDASDPWYIIPQYTDPTDGAILHTFDPPYLEQVVQGHVFDLAFRDELRHTLSGHFGGGDPALCAKNIGIATIRIRTEDGCYDRTIEVNSAVDDGQGLGHFEVDLPPLAYLVEVVSLTNVPEEQEEEIRSFFEQLGTVEVDLTRGDVERNLTYRAPLSLAVEGLADPSLCPSGITLFDEDGVALRTLPGVPVIEAFGFAPLTIRVREDYGGGQFCDVEAGTVTIFDAIADRVDADSTIAIKDGVVEYTTFGASPNVFSGARVGGVDRSFQKPITFVAQVEGRPTLQETQWAIVEGFRERASTFVSATTEEFPLLIVHDPPGSNSKAFLEKGATFCNRISNMKMVGGGGGIDLNLKFGFSSEIVIAPFGGGISIENGGGFAVGTKIVAGQNVTSLQGGQPNRQICVTTTENFSTSDNPGWVSEDLHIGVALNLIFAIADELKFNESQCKIDLSETLAADLDEAEPFATTYAYGAWHIEKTLIPELENLVELAGEDASVEGEINGRNTKIRLASALQNWKKQLKNNNELTAKALEDADVNRSFSGGSEFTFSESVDTTEVTHFESTRIFLNVEGKVGGLLTLFGFDTELFGVFQVNAEWVSETESTQGRSRSIGYTLKDEDAGDYFSVDVAKNPRYGTYVFGTRSGRSSNTCEGNTQCRDNPIILVDPPVMYNVNPGDAASFELTLINGSESNERRRYVLAAPAETNPGNLTLRAGGSVLSPPVTYLLDPGKALTVTLDAYASPSRFSYERVGVMMYPPDEWPIWIGEMRVPFALSDTAFFSVYFDSTGGAAQAAHMQEGWNWFSINREGGDVDSVLENVPAKHGDVLRSQRAESRYDSTAGWTGSLSQLVPGQGYRIRLQEPTMFRVEGEAVQVRDPIELRPGWGWIGYLPAKRMPVAEAMSSLANRVMEGDVIVGQRAFAQYVKGVGWVGPLRDMTPGESYAIYLEGGGSLLYPEPSEAPLPRDPLVRETTVLGPEWKVAPEHFDASMTVVAEIQLNGAPLTYTTLKVAATAGETVRGIGEVHYVEALDKYMAFILVYGDADAEGPEALRLHVYDGEEERLYESVATINYAGQSILGHPASPMVIELSNAGRAPVLADVPVVFALHANFPNPFNQYTTIGYDLPEAAEVKIVVYDLLGRRVALLVDGQMAAGRHKVAFDGRTIASGLYIYRMEIGGAQYTGKMMLVK